MAINDIVQTIAEARVDARSLSEFVFKPAGFKVARRLAPTVDTLQFYINRFNSLNGDFSSSVSVALSSLNNSVTEANGKVAYIESTVQDAINNTAVEGGVLADTFITVSNTINQRQVNMGFDSVADMLAINNPKDGLRVFVKGYHSGSDVGGGDFIYKASTPKSEHDGGNVIDPLKVIPDWNDSGSVTTWLTPNSSGEGCFVRLRGNKPSDVNYGITATSSSSAPALLKHIVDVSKYLNIERDTTGSPLTNGAVVDTSEDSVVIKGDYISEIYTDADSTTALRVRATDDKTTVQENVTVAGTVVRTLDASSNNSFAGINIAGVDGALVTDNRVSGRCGIRLSYSNNPDNHTRPEIKTFHTVASNNIIKTWDLCYEAFGLGNSVVSSSTMTGRGITEGQGVRMVGYGRYTSNTNYTPPHSRIVDMQGRSSVYNALAISKLRWGFTVQQGQVNNVVNAITMEKISTGLELHQALTEDSKQERNIFTSLNINDVIHGVINYGQSKTIFNDVIISNFSGSAYYDGTDSAGISEYKLNRFSGTIVDCANDSSETAFKFIGRAGVYDITVGNMAASTVHGTLNVNNSSVRVIASDFERIDRQAVDIVGNNNIIELNISNIPTDFAVVNIKGDNNIVIVNLSHKDNIEAGYMGVGGKGNVVNGKARILGGYDGSNIINVTNTSKVPLGTVTRYYGTSGITTNRPEFAPVGYQFFDVTLGKPVYFKSAGVWVDSTGATV